MSITTIEQAADIAAQHIGRKLPAIASIHEAARLSGASFKDIQNELHRRRELATAWLQPFTVANAAYVLAFVEMRPELKEILQEAPAEIARYFDGCPLLLDVVQGDDVDETVDLRLRIIAELAAEEATNRLYQLRREWVVNLPQSLQWCFYVTVWRSYEYAAGASSILCVACDGWGYVCSNCTYPVRSAALGCDNCHRENPEKCRECLGKGGR